MTDSIRVFDPGFRVTDTSGNPVAGAKIKFYNAGGLVARTVYSDTGLSTSLGSTVTCNAAGVPAASSGSGGETLIYTGTTSYKVIITDSSDNTLHEFDNIAGALDTSTFDQDTAIPRTPVTIKSTNYSIVDADRGKVFNVDCTGGSVSITLPSAITVGDNWRVTIRHTGTSNTVTIETVSSQTINGETSLVLSYQYEGATLVSDGANWHVSEDALFRRPAGVVLPQGRLTLTSGTPVLSSDVTSATSVYYTPYAGNLVPLYSGTRFVPYEFAELTLTLVSQHEASGIYDVFVFLDGSTLRIGTGPKWGTVTAGSGARGSGAGSTELERISGVLVNAVDITARNGTSTYNVAENKATYLGSIYIDSTQGQVTCHTSFGQNRKWGVWNFYNRRVVNLLVGDATATWTYSGGSVRASNNKSDNSGTAFCGIADCPINVDFRQNVLMASADTNGWRIGIGWNSTSATSGYRGQVGNGDASNTAVANLHAYHRNVPALGINTITCLEQTAGASTATFQGGQEDMLMIISLEA